jgi:type IV pilus assembly protein PilA
MRWARDGLHTVAPTRKVAMHVSQKKGFTLIELLIVVVIIGILAAVAIPKFSNTKQRASRSAGIADMRNLATSQEGFYADSNRYAAIGDTGSTPGRMNFTPSPGNTALTIAATALGWNARITIPGGQACGIYHGNAAVPTGMPATTPSGVPVCW